MSEKEELLMSLLKEQLTRIESKVDRVDERLDNAEKVLIKQEENLKEHMRRTELLESDIKPIKKHVNLMNAGAKIFSFFVILVGLIGGIMKLMGKL